MLAKEAKRWLRAGSETMEFGLIWHSRPPLAHAEEFKYSE
ncbi:hypothetical protein BH11ARM2_BH11ARM2_04320 [soil metagenome]